MARRNRRMLAGLLLVAAGMVGLAFASAPLYAVFCRATGFGGTTQVAKTAPVQAPAGTRTVTVRFTADTNPALPWRFRPLDKEITLHLGEQGLTAFQAVSRADRPTVGTATYNVSPDKAGLYFNKIACFCFDEQVLGPGQSADFPVAFFVDPAFATDPDLQDTRSIVLSYTFFRAKDEAAVLAQAGRTTTENTAATVTR